MSFIISYKISRYLFPRMRFYLGLTFWLDTVSHFLAHLSPFQDQTYIRHVVLLLDLVVGDGGRRLQTGSLLSFFGMRCGLGGHSRSVIISNLRILNPI